MSEESHLPDQLPLNWDKSIFELLQSRLGYSTEKSESLAHALVDILESVAQVYGTTIPDILNQADSTQTEKLQDLVWDIREAFRHIDYHIHDSEILEI